MLHEIGFGPAEALARSSDAARVCRLGRSKGRVAAGYDADLLAVDGNPLTDPTALIRVRAVFGAGTMVVEEAAVSDVVNLDEPFAEVPDLWSPQGHRAPERLRGRALLLEPRGVVNTGDAGGELTATYDDSLS